MKHVRESGLLGLLFLLCLAILCSGPALAAQEHTPTTGDTEDKGDTESMVRVRILDHGLFAASLGAASGELEAARLLKTTDVVPPVPGTFFGISYQADAPEGTASVRLEIRVEHPPLTDPESGNTLDFYTMERSVEPGKTYVQLQRLPQAAAPGIYRFVLLFRGAELASQRFTLTGQPSGFALLQGELLERCRNLEPRLGQDFDNVSTLGEHSFALRLPRGFGLPPTGEVCFLALQADNAAGLAISDMQGRLVSAIQPLERGLGILAVSFSQLDSDDLPEIVVVAENDAQNPPRPDSRVYLAFRSEDNAPVWTRRPDLDQQVAHMQSARAIRRWLAQNAHLPAREPADASASQE